MNKIHFVMVGILAVLALLPLYPYVQSYEFFRDYTKLTDFGKFHISTDIVAKESILKHRQFPLWEPYRLSGNPLLASPQIGVISITTLFNLVMPTVYAGIKASFIFHYILAGIGMYLLMLYFGLRPGYALVSSTVYMWSGTAAYFMYGFTFWAQAFAYLPFIVLLTAKALKEKRWVGSAILAAVLLALIFLGGAVSGFLYTSLLVAAILVYRIITSPNKYTTYRVAAAGLVVFVLAFCLATVKYLPSKEFVDQSSRTGVDAEFEYDYFIDQHRVEFSEFYSFYIKNPDTPFPFNADGYAGIGFVASALVLLSLFRIRNKTTLFFIVLLVLSILYMAGTPVTYVLWKFAPGIDQQKNLDKAQILFSLSAAVLAGTGASVMITKFTRNRRITGVLIALLILVILIDMGLFRIVGLIFTKDPPIDDPKYKNWYFFEDMAKSIEEKEIVKFMSAENEDMGRFRFKVHELYFPWAETALISPYSVPLKVEDVCGSSNIEHMNYFPEFVGVAIQAGRLERFYGILNTKYYISERLVNDTKMEFVGEFEGGGRKFGNYLYKDGLALPRAYIADNAILVAGAEEMELKRVMYSILQMDAFDPGSTVVVMGDLSNPDLFDAIILAQISQDIGYMEGLLQFTQEGGILLPDITKGQSSVGWDDVSGVLATFEKPGRVHALNYSYYSPNVRRIALNGETGFLVLSETFALFGGWTAKLDGVEYPILRANGVVSATPLYGKSGEMVIKYKPKSFILGMTISLVTLIIIIIYGGYALLFRGGAGGK